MSDSVVIIPTYNEKENIEAIIRAVLALEEQHQFDVLVIDDNSPDGTAAIVEFPGVLYRGGDEKKIRQYLIKHNFVDTVIQLPANLFFGVGIATCIIVLKKSAKTDSSVLFIDASKLFQKRVDELLCLGLCAHRHWHECARHHSWLRVLQARGA